MAVRTLLGFDEDKRYLIDMVSFICGWTLYSVGVVTLFAGLAFQWLFLISIKYNTSFAKIHLCLGTPSKHAHCIQMKKIHAGYTTRTSNFHFYRFKGCQYGQNANFVVFHPNLSSLHLVLFVSREISLSKLILLLHWVDYGPICPKMSGAKFSDSLRG